VSTVTFSLLVPLEVRDAKGREGRAFDVRSARTRKGGGGRWAELRTTPGNQG